MGIADLGVAFVLTGKSSTEVEMLNNSVTPYYILCVNYFRLKLILCFTSCLQVTS